MVMNGVAPSMAELAQLYIAADFVFQATYIATAPREYLIRRAADRSMAPYPASQAVFRAEFNIEVPVGTRFSCEDLNFAVTARMDTSYDTETGLSHQVTCDTEALTQDDRITGVENWTFETGRNQLRAQFTVRTIFGDVEAEKEVAI